MDNAYIALPTTSAIAAVLATAIGVEGFDSAVTIPVAESAFAIKTLDNAVALPAKKNLSQLLMYVVFPL